VYIAPETVGEGRRLREISQVRLRALFVPMLLCFTSAAAQPLLDVEHGVFDATNQLRAQNGAGPLALDPLLSEIARGHSEEMLVKGYFSHESPNQLCKNVQDRLKHGHRFCLSSAENLHKAQGYQRALLAKLAIDSWLDSPSHHRNLVNKRFNRIGVGVAAKGDTYLFTQVFSYEPVIVQTLDVTEESGGFRVKISALIADGPREGGWFVDGKRQSSWTAGSDGMISTDLLLAKAGNLAIGQLVGVREWTVETEIPIPPPDLHLKHTQAFFPRFARAVSQFLNFW